MVKTASQCRRCRFDPWVEKIPWRRKWQPTPIFLPGKSQGQRSLAGYINVAESDTTKWLEHSPTRETRVPPCCFPGLVFPKNISFNFVIQPHSWLRWTTWNSGLSLVTTALTRTGVWTAFGWLKWIHKRNEAIALTSHFLAPCAFLKHVNFSRYPPRVSFVFFFILAKLGLNCNTHTNPNTNKSWLSRKYIHGYNQHPGQEWDIFQYSAINHKRESYEKEHICV